MKSKKIISILITAWGVISLFTMAFLMSTHMGVFKTQPTKNLISEGDVEGKYFFHFLYAGCGCSREVAERLKKVKPLSGEIHRVFWIEDGKNQIPQFDKNLLVNSVPADDAILENIDGAPQLVVYEKGKMIYQGGYSHTKTTFLSEWVVEDLQQNRTPASAPIKGCYVPKNKNKLITQLWMKLI